MTQPGRRKRAPDCHPEQPYYSSGLCSMCYNRRYRAKTKAQPSLVRHRADVLAEPRPAPEMSVRLPRPAQCGKCGSRYLHGHPLGATVNCLMCGWEFQCLRPAGVA